MSGILTNILMQLVLGSTTLILNNQRTRRSSLTCAAN